MGFVVILGWLLFLDFGSCSIISNDGTESNGNLRQSLFLDDSSIDQKSKIMLKDFPIIMAHDAGTTYLDTRIPGVTEVVAWTKTQPDGGFEALLSCGARALDIRTEQSNDGTVIMHHGVIPLPKSLKDGMEDVKSWSKKNADQLVLVYFSHFTGSGTKEKTRKLVEQLEGIKVYTDCSSIASMSVNEALTVHGPIIALFDCIDENYNPNVKCEVPVSTFSFSLCFQKENSKASFDRFNNYMNSVSSRENARLSMLQGHWQYDAGAITVGTLYGSSTLKDNQGSKLNHVLANNIANKKYKYINILELDNVCDGGEQVYQALFG